MSSRLQLDMRNLSLEKRHLVNAYEVKTGIGVIAGNTVWSMPERLECEVYYKKHLALPLPLQGENIMPPLQAMGILRGTVVERWSSFRGR